MLSDKNDGVTPPWGVAQKVNVIADGLCRETVVAGAVLLTGGLDVEAGGVGG